MSSPKIDMDMDSVLSVSVASRTCFLMLSDRTCASPFHFIVPLTLKVPDDDLIKVFMSVVWNSCSCVHWNGMEWFGSSWIKAPLLKKIVPDNLCLLLWSVHTALAFNSHLRSSYFLQKVFHLISHSANLLRMQVSSIEGCFDRQKSIEEKSQFDRRL